nr:IclR family transcriptional regulator [Sporomusa silvacetica]
MRTVDILNLIAESKSALTITEISNFLQMPKTSTFDIVYALISKGFLEVADERLKTFGLGIQAFKVGMAYLEKTDLHQAARPLLEYMMNEAGETTFLAMQKNNQIVYLDKVEASSSIRTASCLGSTNPMHCTGVGKALLAAYPNERVRSIISSEGMLPKTEYSLPNLAALLADLDRIRKRGYSIDCRESEVEVFCVAAPVYDRTGSAVAAMSIAGMASRFIGKEERICFCGNLVRATVLRLSQKLGFTGNSLYSDFQ